MSDIATKAGAARGRRPQGPLKKASLERAALHYLERHASSVEGLRRVLARRVERAAREERCDRDEATAWVEDIVTRLARSGMVDDRVFAEGKVASLRRRGGSARRIGMALREKGVDRDTTAAVLEAADGDDRADAEFRAACRLARRRRLGPMRGGPERAERRDRDMAALARAGFAHGVARRVLDLDDSEALEAAIAGLEGD